MTFEALLKDWHDDSGFIKSQTSGSTGSPKEILLPKDFIAQSAIRTINFFGISHKSRLHSCVSPDFIGGKMMAIRADIANASFSWEIPSNRPLTGLGKKFVLDLVAVVPSQVPYILENLNDLPKIKNLLIGGSSIHPDLRQKIVESGINAYESYGMTETASHIALRKITADPLPFSLLPDIEISLDPDSCLVIRIGDEIIATNDIAEIISPTKFYIKGRRDNMIISGGKKINPAELEGKVATFIPNPFFFTGFLDEKWSEKLVLIIEGYLPEKELREKLGSVLNNWEMPKEILFVKKIPLTDNGKIKRTKNIKDLSFLVSSEPDKNPFSSMQSMPG